MTLNDLEWLFYVKFFTITNSLFTYFLYSVLTHATSGDAWIIEYLGSAEKLRIFRRRYIVGTLTNKANISIQYYLVPYRLSTDSKTRDLEWPRMAILR